MVIKVNKFGTILNGRPAGREAALVLRQILFESKKNEELIFDFADVVILTPSFADEFFRVIPQNNSQKVRLINITSPVIIDTLKIIDFQV